MKQLKKDFNDDFEVMWSNMEQQPTLETYDASVRSKKTQYVYDVHVKEGNVEMDYEQENENMQVNEQIEEQLPGVFALTSVEAGNIALTLIANTKITAEELEPVVAKLNVKMIEIIELDEKNYDVSTAYIAQYYQRSNVPLEDLEQYGPKKYIVNF